MELFSHPVIATIIFLGILVFVHEAGHFLIGKLCGISVEVFSIGFGPTIFSFSRKETNYRISVIPLGGYVKFYGAVRGEEVPQGLEGTEFFAASIMSRMATVAAGPIANFLLAIVVFTIIGFHGMKHPPAIVGEIMSGSPAEKAGLQFKDIIKEINGEEVITWKDLQRIVADHPNESLTFEVLRDDVAKQITLVPEVIHDKELARSKGRIGISPSFVPATLTILKSTSPAAAAGIPQGFRVVELGFGGQVYKVKYWRELVNIFGKVSKGTEQITFKGYVENKDPREVTTPPSNLQSYVVDVRELESVSADSIGLIDSQLTLGVLLKPSVGVLAGDRIMSWNGIEVENVFKLSELISNNKKPKADMEVLRAGAIQRVTVELEPIDVQKAEGKVTMFRLPVLFWGSLENTDFVEEKYSNPLKALRYGVRETYVLTKAIAIAVAGLFTGDMPLKALGGPIAIAKVASDSVKMGMIAFLHLLAMISINLGLLNLIPIPVLDGGQLLLIGVEGLARKPLPESIIEGYQKIGFVMVLALIAMATYNDLGRFWASMLKGASSIF